MIFAGETVMLEEELKAHSLSKTNRLSAAILLVQTAFFMACFVTFLLTTQ